MAFSFRLTGSLAEAEDIVQDTFIECAKYNPDEIQNHKAWLTKICSNKALDYIKSARKQRETYVGVWLPDEIPEGLNIWHHLSQDQELDKSLLLSESLTTTFLILFQKLTPQERIVYLLSEIFDYSFAEISEVLNKTIPACKKLAQRARDHISQEKNRFDLPPDDAEKTLRQFFTYAKAGNAEGMASLLSENSELCGDGGGKVRAAGFINDFDSIIQFFRTLVMSEVFQMENYKIELHKVNSRPGVVISKRNESGTWSLDTVLSFEFKANKIACIYTQRNPEKLNSLTMTEENLF